MVTLFHGTFPARRNMAVMSFSFTAAGTRDQTLATLDAVAALPDEGKQVRAMLREFVASGPDDAKDGKQLRYDLHAWGHQGDGSLPSLNVSLTCGYPS
jgi:hypothetical protein